MKQLVFLFLLHLNFTNVIGQIEFDIALDSLNHERQNYAQQLTLKTDSLGQTDKLLRGKSSKHQVIEHFFGTSYKTGIETPIEYCYLFQSKRQFNFQVKFSHRKYNDQTLDILYNADPYHILRNTIGGEVKLHSTYTYLKPGIIFGKVEDGRVTIRFAFNMVLSFSTDIVEYIIDDPLLGNQTTVSTFHNRYQAAEIEMDMQRKLFRNIYFNFGITGGSILSSHFPYGNIQNNPLSAMPYRVPGCKRLNFKDGDQYLYGILSFGFLYRFYSSKRK